MIENAHIGSYFGFNIELVLLKQLRRKIKQCSVITSLFFLDVETAVHLFYVFGSSNAKK